MAQTLTTRLPPLFRTPSWVPWKQSHSSRFGIIKGVFLFCIENGILCVLIRIASMRRFYWEHTIYLHVTENWKDIPTLPLDLVLWLKLISSNSLCLELISWFQRCSSHWSSTVVVPHQNLCRGGRVEGWCWVNFQCRGFLLIWTMVGQGPIALAVGVGWGCLDIFLLSIFSFSLSERWPDIDWNTVSKGR